MADTTSSAASISFGSLAASTAGAIPASSAPASSVVPPAPTISTAGLSLPVVSAPPTNASSSLSVLPQELVAAAASASSSSSTAAVKTIDNDHINNYIDFKLDLAGSNYSKWKKLIHFVLSKYNAQGHVDSYTPPLEQDARWRHDDITILLWIYGTISDELYDVIATPENTAYQAWNLLNSFFRDNQAGRAIHIGAEFRSVVQGDMKIADYCRRLKSLADALDEVEEPISDKTLTLQMIYGLSRRFQVMATVLPMQIPFPTFVQARSRLLLEEIALDARERSEGNAALFIGNANGNNNGGGGGRGGGNPPQQQQQQPQQGNINNNGGGRGQQGGRGGGRGRRGRGRGNGNGNNAGNGGRGGQQQQQQGAQMPWMGYFAPWGAPFPPQGRAPWVAPNAAGILGARPSAPTHAYPTFYAGAPPPQAPSTPSWDQASMLNAAMSNMSLQTGPSGNGEWYLDSGASSHITGNAGPSNQDADHEV